MESICKCCRKNINGFCKVSSEPISNTRKKCNKFKIKYEQKSLFEAVGSSNDANNPGRFK
ncbi:hypothetical protein [Thomasclavelia spiroformis]|uniref:hypothetical protein n=1 Tax=Thomasclavelia spiroformis TaxID=29348 RepID=UPI00399F9DB3